jgi:hypothetical protein
MEICVMPVTLSSLGSKTMRRLTLTSGTSYTVPAGVTYLNVTLVGGGGGGGGTSCSNNGASDGLGGQIMSSTLSATAGASIAYAIGAGGSGSSGAGPGSTGGTTTFTGATSALGGNPGTLYDGNAGRGGEVTDNGGRGGSEANRNGGAGGAGSIIVEYWA